MSYVWCTIWYDTPALRSNRLTASLSVKSSVYLSEAHSGLDGCTHRNSHRKADGICTLDLPIPSSEYVPRRTGDNGFI